jgi:CRISPR-associated protein Cas2
MAHYLICYDIANPKRLGRVHRRTVKRALFVQYSVYYLQGEKESLMELLGELEKIIHPTEDDIRAYKVESLKGAVQLGRSWLPDEITLI